MYVFFLQPTVALSAGLTVGAAVLIYKTPAAVVSNYIYTYLCAQKICKLSEVYIGQW